MRKIRRKLCALLLVAVFMVVAVLPMSSVSAAGTSTTKVTTTTIWKYQLKAYNESLDLINAIKKDGWRVYQYYGYLENGSYCVDIRYVKNLKTSLKYFDMKQIVSLTGSSKFVFYNKKTGDSLTPRSLKNAIKLYNAGNFLVSTYKTTISNLKTPAVIKKMQNKAYEGAKKAVSALSTKGWKLESFTCGFEGGVTGDHYSNYLTFSKTVKKEKKLFLVRVDSFTDKAARFSFYDKNGNSKYLAVSTFVKYINNGNIFGQ